MSGIVEKFVHLNTLTIAEDPNQMRLPTYIVIPFFVACSLLAFAAPAHGQDKGALLPNIDPQDIEIRGEFRARFPGLSRQPILGFDPNMQIYQIDPDRMPFMETGDQVVANLPVSELSRPAAPDYNVLQTTEDIYTFARLGAGSYTSPVARYWGVYPISEKSYIGGDLDFASSDGHLDARPSSFRFLDLNAEFGTRIDDKTELRVYAGGQDDFNYGADWGADSRIPRINHSGFNGGVEVNRFVNDIVGWKLQGNVRTFSSSFEGATNAAIDELTYQGSFANRWALGSPGETLTIKAGGRGGRYEVGSQPTQQWATVQGGVAYERLFNYQTRLHIEADGYFVSDVRREKFYPGGRAKLSHWFGERLKVSGTAEAKPHLNTVETLHERNRFLGYNNSLIHSYSIDVTGEASIKYYRGSKLHGGVTYRNVQDYAYFLPVTISANSPAGGFLDTYAVNYRDATNFKLFAGLTHQLMPERFWLSGQFYIQNPQLDSGDTIPFQESWGANASMTIRPIDRITVEGWADYVGERETGIGNNKVEGFLLVGSQLNVEITDNFGGYVKAVNLLGEEYEVWQGYQERPLQVYGGLTLKF